MTAATADPVAAATRAAQDRRVRWQGPPALRDAVIARLRAQVGWPPLGVSQDETVIADDVIATADGGVRVRFSYVLDRDFASQYDATDATVGEVVLGPADVAAPDRPGDR